jgi:hypothetical protein
VQVFNRLPDPACERHGWFDNPEKSDDPDVFADTDFWLGMGKGDAAAGA